MVIIIISNTIAAILVEFRGGKWLRPLSQDLFSPRVAEKISCVPKRRMISDAVNIQGSAKGVHDGNRFLVNHLRLLLCILLCCGVLSVDM